MHKERLGAARARAARVGARQARARVEAKRALGLARLEAAYRESGAAWPPPPPPPVPVADFMGTRRGRCSQCESCTGYQLPHAPHALELLMLCACCGCDAVQHEAVQPSAPTDEDEDER